MDQRAQTGMLHDAAAIVQRARADPTPVPTFEPNAHPGGWTATEALELAAAGGTDGWQIFTHAASIRHDLTALIEPVRRLRCVRQAAASSSPRHQPPGRGFRAHIEGSTSLPSDEGFATALELVVPQDDLQAVAQQTLMAALEASRS